MRLLICFCNWQPPCCTTLYASHFQQVCNAFKNFKTKHAIQSILGFVTPVHSHVLWKVKFRLNYFPKNTIWSQFWPVWNNTGRNWVAFPTISNWKEASVWFEQNPNQLPRRRTFLSKESENNGQEKCLLFHHWGCSIV